MNNDNTNQTPAYMQQDPYEGAMPPQGATPPQPNMQEGYNPQWGFNPYASDSAMQGYSQPLQSANMQEQINQARDALGIQAMAEELQAMKDNATYNANLAQTISQYPNVTKEALETELKKLDEKNPSLANAIRLSADGMDMFAKGLSATITPNTKVDNITDDTNTANNTNNSENALVGKIKGGKASEVELGSYLNSFGKNTK